jgi:hypothetical protein
MSETCPTVQVKSDASPQGFIIINEADFDAAVHALFDAPAGDGSAAKAPAEMTVKELKAELGADAPAGATKADLVTLVTDARAKAAAAQ